MKLNKIQFHEVLRTPFNKGKYNLPVCQSRILLHLQVHWYPPESAKANESANLF